MTSNPGANSPKDEFFSAANHDVDADESFATAPDVWQDEQGEEYNPLDESREIADLKDHEDLSDFESRDSDDAHNSDVNDDESLSQGPEDDTIPSLDQELQAEQDASDSSLFQGPSPPGSSRRGSISETSRPSSAISLRRRSGAIRPFERRAQARNASVSSIASLRASSPAFLSTHSRQASASSQITIGSADQEEEHEEHKPWEVIRWTKLRKVSSQLFSETGRRAFGVPTYLTVGASIVIGTSKGLIMLFDYQQNLKNIIGQGTPAAECGTVSALAISADHTTIAAGHTSGFIFTWDLNSPSKPFLTIPPLPRKRLAERAGDGHVSDQAVLHVGFLGTRHTALVSADENGMAFSHLATRGLGAMGRTVKTTRLLGRYPYSRAGNPPNLRPSTVLHFAPLPLGNIVQTTDDMGLTALLTPYLLVIVSTTPVAQTQFKTARTRQAAAHGAMTGCLAWFPAVKLKTSGEGSALKVARSKLAYCWSNVLSVLEVEAEEVANDEEHKRPALHFHVRRQWKSEEAIVAVQWVSRSVIALLTITQRLVILEDQTMHVTDNSDLNPRHIYHRDLFSRQLEPLVSKADQEDKTMHGVVPDAYSMSFKAYKSRLFLLNASDVSMGTLSNWADRLVAMMDAGQLIEAIELATIYFNGSADKVTVGLPDEDSARHPMVKERLLQMISAALRYTFKMDESDELGKDLRSALQELVEPIFTACIEMDEVHYLFDEVYEWYADASCQDAFFHALEPRIVQQQVTSVPTEALKDMMNWYASLGMAQRLQEMLVSLDTATLDLDQVLSLCKELNLFDAFIHVWNQAVEDYVAPLAELIHVAQELQYEDLDILEDSERYHSAMKMFPYMAYITTGRIYPEGSEMNALDAETAQSAIYKYLFASTRYEPLRAILSFSTAEFMSTLNEAFEDAYLNDRPTDDSSDEEEVDLLNRTSFRINRQRIVQTLLDVIASKEYDLSHRIYLDIFIARNMPKYPQYILLPGNTLQSILKELCEPPHLDLADECQLSVEYLLSVFRPSNTQTLISLFEQARFYRVLKATYKADRQFLQWLETYFDDPDDPYAVFDAIEDCFAPRLALNQRQIREVKSIIINHTKQLTDLDVARTATTLRSSSPDLLEPVFTHLRHGERTRFLFLQALLEPANSTFAKNSDCEIFIDAQRTTYIELMCSYSPDHVSDYVTSIGSSSLNLDSILPIMERRGVIDAAVVLMADAGLQRDAMDRLLGHLRSLQVALVGMIDSGQPDQFHDIIAEVEKFTKMGIWLCRPASGGASPSLKGYRPPTKLQRQDLTDSNLTGPETLWLDLANAVTDLSMEFSSAITASSRSNIRDLTSLGDAVRHAVHDVFTALLSASTSHSNSNTVTTNSAISQLHESSTRSPRLIPILRAFLETLSAQTSRINDTRPADNSVPDQGQSSTLLPILTSIFDAHIFSSSLLTLSYKLLSKDIFTEYSGVVEARKRGWRPNGRACISCGERTWGVGAGLRAWENWAWRKRRDELEKRRQRDKDDNEEDGKGKGKGRAQPPEAEETAESGQIKGEGRQGIVAFACGHLFHRTCLEGGMRTRGMTADRGRRGAGGSEKIYACLMCH